MSSEEYTLSFQFKVKVDSRIEIRINTLIRINANADFQFGVHAKYIIK